MGEIGISHFFGRTRFIILILSLFTLIFAFSNSLVFTFTVICMDDVQDDWLRDPAQVNSLFSALAIGCLIGTLPISYCVQKWGTGLTCALFGAASSIATVFFPLAVKAGYPAVFVARAIQGIPNAISFVAMGQISSQWSTEKGMATFVSVLSTHIQLCSVFTLPVSSSFCTSPFGWQGAYYLHGILSLIIFAIFYLFYSDSPESHKNVSQKELDQILKGKTNLAKEKSVPYKAILSDSCVWSTWIAIFGSTAGYQTFFFYAPTYLNKALGMNISSTGWGSALPFLLSAILKFFLGPISDSATCISQRIRLVFFTMMSHGLMALLMVVMSLTTSATIAHIAFTGAIVASAIVAVGTFSGASMVARQYVHFVMAVCSFIMVLINFAVPALVAYLCPNNTPEEWSRLFLIMAGFVFVTALPYCFFAKGKPAKWTLAIPKGTQMELQL